MRRPTSCGENLVQVPAPAPPDVPVQNWTGTFLSLTRAPWAVGICNDLVMKVSILTREYPPHIYGGAGVHVGQLVPQLRAFVDVDVQCMGEPRVGATAHAESFPEGANAALRVFGADLSMVNSLPDDLDLVHSHPW